MGGSDYDPPSLPPNGSTLTPASSVTGPDAFGSPSVVGSSANYARQDHDHGLPVGSGFVQVNNPTSYYKVYQAGGTTTAVRLDTGAVQSSSATPSTVLNALIALQSGATATIAIEIDPNFTGDSAAITVNKPNITIWTPDFGSQNGTTPVIPTLTLSDSTNKISGCYFFGFGVNVLTMNAGTNGITFNEYMNMLFQPVSNVTSIVQNFESTGTSTGIQYQKFNFCWFKNSNSGATTPAPFWLCAGATGTAAGNGHNELVGCSYLDAGGSPTNPNVFISVTGALKCGPPLFNIVDLDFVTLVANTVQTYVYQCTLPASGTQQSELICTSSYFESDGSLTKKEITFFQLVSGAGGSWTGYCQLTSSTVLGDIGFTIVDAVSPVVSATKTCGIKVAQVISLTGLPKTAGAYLTIASGVAQGTGATAPALSHTGQGTNGWHVDLESVGPSVGYAAIAPTNPNASVYLVNLYTRPIEILVTVLGSGAGATIKDFQGNTQSQVIAPVAGSKYILQPLEQLTFTTWPTTSVWRML